MAGARDARCPRRVVPRQLREGARAEPRLHLRLRNLCPAGAGGRDRDRTDLRRSRALRGRVPAGRAHQPDRAAADPGGMAAGPRAAPGDRARDESPASSAISDTVTDLFDGIVGHAQALEQLRSQAVSGRLAHAYLFVGESGLGKTSAGRALAASLLPEAALTRHPDYWEDDRIKPLSINEIRLLPDKPPEFHELSLQAFLNLKPAVGARRVAVVANVGRLRDQDQSVLLKTLEEPHPHRVIVLTTPSLNPFVVLPTVVSRCQRVFFHPVPSPEIEKLLARQGVAAGRAKVVAELARGRPGWAVRVAGDEAVIELHENWTRARWPGGGPRARLRTLRSSRSRAGRSSCASGCSPAGAASRAPGPGCSSCRMTRSGIWNRTSAPVSPWKHFCSNVEKLRKEGPSGLQALRPGRAAAGRRGLGQAQHQRVTAAAFPTRHPGDQGGGRRVASPLSKPDRRAGAARDREAFRPR